MMAGITIVWLVCLSFGLAIGISLLLLANLINNNWLGIILLVPWIITPGPVLLSKHLRWPLHRGFFLSGFAVGTAFALPSIIYHFDAVGQHQVTLLFLSSIFVCASLLLFVAKYEP